MASHEKSIYHTKFQLIHTKNGNAQPEKFMYIYMKNHVTAKFIVCHFFPKNCLSTHEFLCDFTRACRRLTGNESPRSVIGAVDSPAFDLKKNLRPAFTLVEIFQYIRWTKNPAKRLLILHSKWWRIQNKLVPLHFFKTIIEQQIFGPLWTC